MGRRLQELQPGKQPRNKRFPWKRLTITVILLIVIIIVAVAISNIQSSIILAILGIAVSLFQWLLPVSSSSHEIPKEPPPTSSANANAHVGKVGQLTPPDPKIIEGQVCASDNERARVGLTGVQPDSVFLFNVQLTDPNEFYGRVRERQTLINRTRKGASTSIVGSRRIGKTWLIDYLKLVAPTELGSRFRVAHLDATMASCATVAGFTAKVLEELGIHAFISDHTNLELAMLERVVQDLKSKNQIPVVSIDEFEGFGNRQAFDVGFFISLRAMTQAGLSLVVTSKRPLIDIVGDYGQTSGFFNVFEQLSLKPFNTLEAETFARAKSIQAGFTDRERTFLLNYGQKRKQQWPPIRLQLVGKLLLEDKTLAESENAHYYRPDDPNYWREFEERLEEKYRGVVQ